MKRETFLLIALAVTLVWAVSITSRYNGASEASQTAKDSVATLSDQLEGLRERETILADSAAKADSVAQAVRDSVADIIAETDTVLVTKLDSVRVIVQDTTALRIIDEMEAVHALRLASKDSVIAAQERQIALFPQRLASLQQIVTNLEIQVEQQAIVITDQDRRIRGQKVAKWTERTVLVAAALCGFGVVCR